MKTSSAREVEYALANNNCGKRLRYGKAFEGLTYCELARVGRKRSGANAIASATAREVRPRYAKRKNGMPGRRTALIASSGAGLLAVGQACPAGQAGIKEIQKQVPKLE